MLGSGSVREMSLGSRMTTAGMRRICCCVVDMFEAHPEWRGIAGCEASAENAVNKHRFDQVAGPVTRQNIWRRHISFAAFFRKADLTGLFYDERLGIGAETSGAQARKQTFCFSLLSAEASFNTTLQWRSTTLTGVKDRTPWLQSQKRAAMAWAWAGSCRRIGFLHCSHSSVLLARF